MSLVVVGLNHKTAPVALLEKLSVADQDLPKALHQLGTYEHVLEGAILSTCNRTEVYAVVSKFHGGAQDVRNFLAEYCHLAPEDFVDHLYTYHDESAVRHLFRVAAGVDSMVVGESEILGQVRRSFQFASIEGLTDKRLNYALRQAMRVGKRVRSETAIGKHPVSISSAAVELARQAFPKGSLKGKSVVVLGAGKMGRQATKALVDAGAAQVTVVNRSEDRARAAVDEFGVESRSFRELSEAIKDADIVISSTTAPGTVIDASVVAPALDGDRDRPLFVVDIAVPRDVEPSISDLPGVILRDIDDLKQTVDKNMGDRLAELPKVDTIVGDEVDHYLSWERASEIEPAVAMLVKRAEEIRTEQVERMRDKMGGLTDEQRDQIDQLTRRIVAKLLHAPVTQAKELTASKQGHVYLAALRELFELDDDASE